MRPPWRCSCSYNPVRHGLGLVASPSSPNSSCLTRHSLRTRLKHPSFPWHKTNSPAISAPGLPHLSHFNISIPLFFFFPFPGQGHGQSPSKEGGILSVCPDGQLNNCPRTLC